MVRKRPSVYDVSISQNFLVVLWQLTLSIILKEEIKDDRGRFAAANRSY